MTLPLAHFCYLCCNFNAFYGVRDNGLGHGSVLRLLLYCYHRQNITHIDKIKGNSFSHRLVSVYKVIFMWTHTNSLRTTLLIHMLSGAVLQRARLKPDAVPSKFQWSSIPSPASRARAARCQVRHTYSCAPAAADLKPEATEVEIVACADAMGTGAVIEIQDTVASGSVTASVQTDEIHVTVPCTVVSSETQTSDTCSFDIDNFINDSVGLQFYTGLDNYEAFVTVLASLGPAAYQLNYLYGKHPVLSVANQLLLTLIKLRLYKTNFELSRHFNISEAEVYIIFVTWIRLMALQWREINLWPDRKTVHFFAPVDFYDKFPTTRVIVDRTEMPIKVPKAPAAQQMTFSTYKNRNTVKVLVGVTPGGLVSFVSDAYGGSASDR